MIKRLANLLATEAGVKLSSIELEDGRPLGCKDVHLLTMKSKGMDSYTTISNNDLAVKYVLKISDLTKEKIRKAIERLKALED